LCCSTKVVMMHLLSFVNLIATIARQPHGVFFFHTSSSSCTQVQIVSHL
jgi:hypothetical protein